MLSIAMMLPTGTKRDGSNNWVLIAVLYECTTCVIVPSEGPTVVNKGRKKSCQSPSSLSLPSLSMPLPPLLPSLPLPSLLLLPPLPPPAFADPYFGWLLCCCPSSFVIPCRHVTINTLVTGRFCCRSTRCHRRHYRRHRCSCCWATTTATHHRGLNQPPSFIDKEKAAAPPPPPAYQLQHHRENIYKSTSE